MELPDLILRGAGAIAGSTEGTWNLISGQPGLCDSRPVLATFWIQVLQRAAHEDAPQQERLLAEGGAAQPAEVEGVAGSCLTLQYT